MAGFRFTKYAAEDLAAIWEYTVDTWSEKQADRYYKGLIHACMELATAPEKGKDYSEIYPGLKGQKTSKHIIFYREIDSETIEITRILHERMDLKHKWSK